MNPNENLYRFIEAQNLIVEDFLNESHKTKYETAKEELLNGQKTSHWMWYIFPQIKGLGKSEMATKFAISNINEARDYYNNSVLGPRLEELVSIVNEIEGKTAVDIFGEVDAMKFLSCLTLFNQVAPENQVFIDAMNKYYEGRQDKKTIKILEDQASF
ncbi:DUF1810 domain-containing protein [Candidatus Saccharibacteria bacterium]|nr:DUF1810 domain-containing protein [Candidatus Saccharibacteria bacterium]